MCAMCVFLVRPLPRFSHCHLECLALQLLWELSTFGQVHAVRSLRTAAVLDCLSCEFGRSTVHACGDYSPSLRPSGLHNPGSTLVGPRFFWVWAATPRWTTLRQTHPPLHRPTFRSSFSFSRPKFHYLIFFRASSHRISIVFEVLAPSKMHVSSTLIHHVRASAARSGGAKWCRACQHTNKTQVRTQVSRVTSEHSKERRPHAYLAVASTANIFQPALQCTAVEVRVCVACSDLLWCGELCCDALWIVLLY